MSWFSNLVHAYDRIADIAGVAVEGKEDKVLLPLYHALPNTHICITLDENGKFLSVDKTPLKICAPCTEDSRERTGQIAPYALHEQLVYLVFDKKKRDAYLSLLSEWCNRNPKVKAVYTYVINNTMLDDLRRCDVAVDVVALDNKGNVKKEATLKKELENIEKTFVRFRVVTGYDLNHNLWEDKEVSKAWQNYRLETEPNASTLCYATGTILPPASKHSKDIITFGPKLISCNDETNFTYKGRFTKADQPNAISAEASQKAHAMLKYLVANHGRKCGTQAIVAWAIDNGEEQLNPFASTDYLYGSVATDEGQSYLEDYDHLYGLSLETEQDKIANAQGKLATDYAKKLRTALAGKGNAKALENTSRRMAVIAMDAATTGRMGITFYQDLPQNEYIERILAWHDSCCWWFYINGEYCKSAPSADRIISAVYGEPPAKGSENYDKIKKQARERLLYNIVCNQPLDRAWVSAAVARASRPFSYNKKDGGWDKWQWETAINVTCAMVRKYYQKEVLDLVLDKTNADRSYLFGRLLAIANKIESHARYLQEGKTGGTDKRPTNAVRYMSAFASKPLRTWKLIFDQLNPYVQRLNGAEWYQQQIDEIMSLFEPCALDDKPLDGKYLLGYSLQRMAFKKDNQEDEENESN